MAGMGELFNHSGEACSASTSGPSTACRSIVPVARTASCACYPTPQQHPMPCSSTQARRNHASSPTLSTSCCNVMPLVLTVSCACAVPHTMQPRLGPGADMREIRRLLPDTCKRGGREGEMQREGSHQEQPGSEMRLQVGSDAEQPGWGRGAAIRESSHLLPEALRARQKACMCEGSDVARASTADWQR